MTSPRITIPKLKVCCVARETFSLLLSSDHEILPSSLMTDICFLVGPDVDVAARRRLFLVEIDWKVGRMSAVDRRRRDSARKEREELGRRKRLIVKTRRSQHR